PHAFAESFDARSHFLDYTSQFVAKQGGRHDHASVVAALIHLQIGAAGKGHLHFDEHFSHVQSGNRYPFDLDVLFPIEDGRCHLSHACWSFHELPGCITTFIESGLGWAANCNASTDSFNGKRWLISLSNSISPLSTNCADFSCKSTDALYEP